MGFESWSGIHDCWFDNSTRILGGLNDRLVRDIDYNRRDERNQDVMQCDAMPSIDEN